jgi:hypothetical protein
MKKILTAALLAAVIATPALAATKHRTAVHNPNADFAYVTDPDTVVVNGTYLGRDPDPAIRADLLRQGDQSEIAGQ